MFIVTMRCFEHCAKPWRQKERASISAQAMVGQSTKQGDTAIIHMSTKCLLVADASFFGFVLSLRTKLVRAPEKELENTTQTRHFKRTSLLLFGFALVASQN